jgi:hypothetical protein
MQRIPSKQLSSSLNRPNCDFRVYSIRLASNWFQICAVVPNNVAKRLGIIVGSMQWPIVNALAYNAKLTYLYNVRARFDSLLQENRKLNEFVGISPFWLTLSSYQFYVSIL